MTDTSIPADTQKSRLSKTARTEDPDDFARAGDRIAAFWRKHPDGNILTEVEQSSTLVAGVRVITFTARTIVRKDATADAPSATAHATRSTADADEITAAFAQETAETASVSRALRNLGILAVKRKTKAQP